MHHQSRIIILSIVLATIHTSQAANQEQVLEDYLLSVVRALKGPRRIEPSTDAPEDEMKTQTVGQLQSEAMTFEPQWSRVAKRDNTCCSLDLFCYICRRKRTLPDQLQHLVQLRAAGTKRPKAALQPRSPDMAVLQLLKKLQTH
ncbi:hypothetical protein CAPTEDRAFT_211577 [Capitella teleta]|uniref:Uncharacterized protein n=1 Tax=Capitella teleta TaxID=283909 RepID=R7TWJ1_CAPTE|nr:hypothetical protein CAPTEDRAFT_211577 [Capitella teleta]|eukprot:ELT95330.1 hypothetical protein CAPTEDRAFT_211577 [Capitella teleta]